MGFDARLSYRQRWGAEEAFSLQLEYFAFRYRRHLSPTQAQIKQFERWERMVAEHFPAEMHGDAGSWD